MIEPIERRETSLTPTARRIVELVIIFAAYFIAGKLGQATSNIRSGNVGPVWPAYGIAVAAILICGYRVWYVLAAAIFVVAWISPVPPLIAAGQTVSSVLAFLTAGYLLRRVGFHRSLDRLRDAGTLIVLGGFASAAVSATLGSAVLYAGHMQTYSGMGKGWLIYWLGDCTGVLLVTPLVLSFTDFLKIRTLRRWGEFVALLLLLSGVSYVMFSETDRMTGMEWDIMAFMVLPVIMWGAVRFGMGGVTLANCAVAAIATVETAFGSGPFAHNTPLVNAAMLDMFFMVLSLSGLSLAAVIAERGHAQRERESLIREQAMMEAQAQLGAIVESSDDAILGVLLDGAITNWNKGAENLYGYSAKEAIGRPIDMLIPEGRRQNCALIISRIKEGEAIQHYETIRRKKDGTTMEVSLTASPIRNAEGQVIGLSSIERDIGERRRQEQVLHDSIERFQLAAQAGRMFAYEWDAARDVVVRSAEAASILGVGASEQMTAKETMASVHPDDRARVEAAVGALTPERPHLQITYRKIRADGDVIWVERHSVAHFDEQGRLVRIVGMVADITARKRAEAALAKARAKLIAAQEEERTRIARELHDDLGQRLALLTVELELLQDSSSIPGEAQERLSQLREESMAMAHDIQVLSHELHSAKLEYLGLGPAITGFCREFSEKQRVEVDCSAHDLPSAVPSTVSMNLFRVVQEALHNALKHSGADHFEVRLWGTEGDLQLTIRDSGAGFDRQQLREGRGLGLISMQERLELLHGTLSIKSEPNLGTTIHARVPLAGTDPMRAAS